MARTNPKAGLWVLLGVAAGGTAFYFIWRKKRRDRVQALAQSSANVARVVSPQAAEVLEHVANDDAAADEVIEAVESAASGSDVDYEELVEQVFENYRSGATQSLIGSDPVTPGFTPGLPGSPFSPSSTSLLTWMPGTQIEFSEPTETFAEYLARTQAEG